MVRAFFESKRAPACCLTKGWSSQIGAAQSKCPNIIKQRKISCLTSLPPVSFEACFRKQKSTTEAHGHHGKAFSTVLPNPQNLTRSSSLTSATRQTSIGTGYDLANSIFSPDGRNFQVEYAVKAVENGGTSIGIRCKDGVVLAVEKVITSKLLKPGANKRIATVDRNVGVVGFSFSLLELWPVPKPTS